ncbi:MAG: fused MFS/spermidine synthase [Candidatus Limnocylindrales bacterium]
MTARSIPLARPIIGTTLPFALPIGLSAFLLFSVEPLIGRLVLPIFGGTPAVWATTLFFFQTILLIGYLYGHLSITRLGWVGPPVHLAVAGLALVALLIAPSDISGLRDTAVVPVLDLVRILFVIIGLPAIVLTTTTPLVSGWFEVARSQRAGGDPYWLYALSNGGSLLALLAYPLVIEPRLGLADQRGIWAVGYALLVVLLAVAGMRVVSLLRARSAVVGSLAAGPLGAAPAASRAIDWPRRARWLLLAAIPSGLLSAVTTFIATDLVSAPLLWVAPLAIYLLTFVIAFSPRGGRAIRLASVAAPAMITLLWVPYGSAGGWPVLAVLGMELIAFGVLATALHGRLAQDRPDPAHLTEFYLTISIGGALASAFVALVAPSIFPGVWELPILLVGALVALALVAPAAAAKTRIARSRGLDFGPFFVGFQERMLPYLVAAALLAASLLSSGALAAEAGIRWLLVGGLILLVGARPWFLVVATTLVLALATFVLQPPAEFRARSFFGVTEVLTSPEGDLKLLMNGTTVHGSQATDPALRRRPQSYYVQAGPVGDLFANTDRRTRNAPAVAVTGLGGGAIAAYALPATTMTFFEIDPIVIQVASDPRYFTYLTDAPTRPTIVEGDGRLSLRKVPDGQYDLLIMDAFSSDSVPVHLLTAEAITDELRTLAPDGSIAFHISNRYYDLAPAISAALAGHGMTALERRYQPDSTQDPGASPSRWLAASSDPSTIDALGAAGWETVTPGERPFTDDYADLLSYLQLGS